MRHAIAATAGALAVIAIYTLNPPEPTVVYITEEIETVEYRERLRIVEFEELRLGFIDLETELNEGCIDIIEHMTGDPRQGIINLVDRHYQGDACNAAEEAIRGEW
jgi:hypothetical protein